MGIEVIQSLAIKELILDEEKITSAEIVANGTDNVVVGNLAPGFNANIVAWEKFTKNGSVYYQPLFQ